MKWLAAAAAGALMAVTCLVGGTARAGLIGAGANTVSANFYLGSFDVSNVEHEDVQTSPGVFVAGPVIISNSGVDFVEGANDLSTIHIGDTAITISNLAPSSQPFCTVSTGACPDSFTGFEFLFSAGVDILGVTVDPASAAAFQPSSLIFTATSVVANVVGDAPSPGDQLILDLQFTPTQNPVPEPATLATLAVALIGLLAVRHAQVAPPRRRPAVSGGTPRTRETLPT